MGKLKVDLARCTEELIGVKNAAEEGEVEAAARRESLQREVEQLKDDTVTRQCVESLC